jgi:hypothetical protein
MARGQTKNKPIRRGTLESEVYKSLSQKHDGFALAIEIESKLGERAPSQSKLAQRRAQPVRLQLRFGILPRLIGALESYAIETGKSRTEIVEEALTEYLSGRVPWFGWDKTGSDTAIRYEVPEIPNAVLDTIGVTEPD